MTQLVLVIGPVSLPWRLAYPLRGRVDQSTVEAGGLGIQGQHELLLLE